MTLEIRDVQHSFGDRVALDGVSLDVVPGVLTGLLGPNGAGKTTLLRILLGVLSPDHGEVHFDGRPVIEEDRRRWGYMPQERGLYPGMPAGDQVMHFGRLHGLSKHDATTRAHALLGELDLTQPYPGAAAEGQRGRAGSPKQPHVPYGWLESRELSDEFRAELREDLNGGAPLFLGDRPGRTKENQTTFLISAIVSYN